MSIPCRGWHGETIKLGRSFRICGVLVTLMLVALTVGGCADGSRMAEYKLNVSTIADAFDAASESAKAATTQAMAQGSSTAEQEIAVLRVVEEEFGKWATSVSALQTDLNGLQVPDEAVLFQKQYATYLESSRAFIENVADDSGYTARFLGAYFAFTSADDRSSSDVESLMAGTSSDLNALLGALESWARVWRDFLAQLEPIGPPTDFVDLHKKAVLHLQACVERFDAAVEVVKDAVVSGSSDGLPRLESLWKEASEQSTLLDQDLRDLAARDAKVKGQRSNDQGELDRQGQELRESLEQL